MTLKTLKKSIRSALRLPLNWKNKRRLTNRDFSIISANCVGGTILHELGQRFDTPTINLYFSAGDFLKFSSNLEAYIHCELTEIDSPEAFPVGKLGDLTLHFVHYRTFNEAKEKWESRCKRIHWDNLYFIMVDRDGCTEEIIEAFDRLPYVNKTLLTYKERPGVKCARYIKGTEDEGKIRDLCEYVTKFSGRRWVDRWDYVSFLNQTSRISGSIQDGQPEGEQR